MHTTDYELIIIGGGPAGLTAGMYAARARLKTLLIEKGALGGQVLVTDWVDNYPGFVEGCSGFDLIDKMTAHADRFGLEKKIATVASLELEGIVKKIILEDGSTLTARTVILCTGARPNKLDIPGELEFSGKGVSYCATCDGPFYRNQHVVVSGGGNTAIQEALYLTKFCSKVSVVHRRDQLRATKILQEKAFAEEKIEFILEARVTEVKGDQSGVTGVVVTHNNKQQSIVEATGIFIFIGTIPNNDILPRSLSFDESGFVITDAEMRTNIEGVYCAGDIRSKRFRQIINGAGEGAVAQLSAEHYLGGQP